MDNKVYVVAIIGKDIFHNRLHLEQEFAEVLYDQIISILPIIGSEILNSNVYPDLRLGVYLDTNNPGTRKFELCENNYYIFCDNFGHKFFDKLKNYSERQQKEGTNVLFQLNNGNITMGDFEKRIK